MLESSAARGGLAVLLSSFMVGKILLPEIRELIAERNFAALRELFREMPPADVAEVILDLFVDRGGLCLAFERNGEQAGRLVDDEQCVILEEDLQIADFGHARSRLCTARAVHPYTDDIPLGEPARGVGQRQLAIVDEDLAALEGRPRASAGSEPRRRREVFVDAGARLVRSNRPLHERYVTMEGSN